MVENITRRIVDHRRLSIFHTIVSIMIELNTSRLTNTLLKKKIEEVTICMTYVASEPVVDRLTKGLIKSTFEVDNLRIYNMFSLA